MTYSSYPVLHPLVPRRGPRWVERGALAIGVERDPPEMCVLGFYGELDLTGSELAARELRRAIATNAIEIIVDLSGLDFVDSAGLRVFAGASAQAGSDRRLLFLRGHGQVERVINATGVGELLPFAD